MMSCTIKMKHFMVLWCFLVYGQFLSKVVCLKDLKVTVPEAVAAGDTVTLQCQYDLQAEQLYSVRWYFDLDEFYRFVPKESPPSRVFPVQGVSVDLVKSDENSVTLRSVSKIQSGSYQCEVSADAPSFHTESHSATMVVAELPLSEPVMTVSGTQNIEPNKKVVRLGDVLTATCVSGPSDPIVNFTWTINGFPMQAKQSGVKDIDTDNSFRHHEAWSEITIRVDSKILPPHSRKIKFRCQSNVYSLYKGDDEIEFDVLDSNYWIHGGGKVSPTTDQRSGSNRGDPDNSALTGNAVFLHKSFLSRLSLVILSFILFFCLS